MKLTPMEKDVVKFVTLLVLSILAFQLLVFGLTFIFTH